MATYYVRPDGNNANAGTADSAAGAWKTVKYAFANAQNGVLANGDIVFVVGDQGTYTENAITLDRAVICRSLRGGVVIDGTGGAAGSDVITITAAGGMLEGFTLQNAVDNGVVANVTGFHASFVRCVFKSNGTNGVSVGGGSGGRGAFLFCRAEGNGTNGYSAVNLPLHLDYCAADSNTSVGASSLGRCVGSLFTDSGSHGATLSFANQCSGIIGSTFEGNTGDGLRISTTTPWATGLSTDNPEDRCFINCSFTNNSGYGVNCSAGALTQSYVVDYCNYYGNNGGGAGGNRNNFDTGTNDKAVDPLFVNAAGDDYTLDTGSGLIAAGYSSFKTPVKLNIGATIAEIVTAPDFPAEDDVRDGVQYDGTTFTGNLVLPTEPQVEAGVGFGSNGTEFTGSFQPPPGQSRVCGQWGIR